MSCGWHSWIYKRLLTECPAGLFGGHGWVDHRCCRVNVRECVGNDWGELSKNFPVEVGVHRGSAFSPCSVRYSISWLWNAVEGVLWQS